MEKKITVLMPTYNQSGFIRRAWNSLKQQTYKNWELIIINDGSTDYTEYLIQDIIQNTHVHYLKNNSNEGLGFSLNRGLNMASGDYIAYLPSDDFYYTNHLESLSRILDSSKDIILAFSGAMFDNNDSINKCSEVNTSLIFSGNCLQLVQVCHKKTCDQWLERKEYVTEDLFLMYWNKPIRKGMVQATLTISCFWTQHPNQRLRMISESATGNLNKYRLYYKVEKPIRMRNHKYKFVDEEVLYTPFRANLPLREDGLKILLVGELSYNPERMYVFEEAGHKLYGLWMQNPSLPMHYIGKLPFGNIEDISTESEKWTEKVKEINPDIIYGLSNMPGIADVAKYIKDIKKDLPDIPFLWHFKEGPFEAMAGGVWNDFIYLHTIADGIIYLNELYQKWIEQFITDDKSSYILDMDLPKKDYFTNNFSPKLSDKDGEIHTFVAGRFIGIEEIDVRLLAQNNIHIHIYSESYHFYQQPTYQFYQTVAPKHFHLHPRCPNDQWVEEFSRYDAGWLHLFDSNNEGQLQKMNWDDLNLPCRTGTYAAAGVPMILKKNTGSIVAINELLKSYDIALLIDDTQDLCDQLQDKARMKELSENIYNCRKKFTFDYHYPMLIDYFRQVINSKKEKR